MDNEFILQDRLQKIKQIVDKYGEENFYISYSGGKDSCVLSTLVDMALPDNQIPRVYINTGIEYKMIVDFVNQQREKPKSWQLHIVKPCIPIKQMLERDGYPFKSKKHAKKVGTYQRCGWTATAEHYVNLPEKEFGCPERLKYQFSDECKLKIDYKCCINLKEKPLIQWAKENGKKYAIIGIMKDEGGTEESAMPCS